MKRVAALIALLFIHLIAFAAKEEQRLDLTGNWVGISSLDTVCVETCLETPEEHYQMLKSHLLEAGAQGQLPVAEMDARLLNGYALLPRPSSITGL